MARIASGFRHAAALALLAAALLPQAAGAAAAQRLAAFLEDTRALRARFVQEIVAEDGTPTERTSGTLAVLRPGRFRWDYREPYRQLIVADGERLWIYDEDLAQVTVRPQARALGRTPLQILGAPAGRALEGFAVRELGLRGGLEWVELVPQRRGEDGPADFERIRVGFEGPRLARMELVDAYGQTVRLRFEAVERNPPLAAALFRFTPPPGVDVVRDEGGPRPAPEE